MGDGNLRISADIASFAERFDALFGDCGVDTPRGDLPTLDYSVRSGGESGIARADIDGPALDLERFARHAFPDREIGTFPLAEPWQGLAVGPGTGADRFGWSGRHLEVLSGDSWPSFLGSLAVACTMRLQPDVAFVHAGSAEIGGRGILLCGPKGSGKTTLTLAIGASGHAVLGDEVAAIRLRSRELLPFRRAASVRPGPSSAAAATLLRDRPWSSEIFADGQPRMRVPLSELFPRRSVPDAVPLAAVFVLAGMGAEASLERTRHAMELLPNVNLLGASLWDVPPGARAFKLLSALSGIPCFTVRCGGVDETCRLIEGAVLT